MTNPADDVIELRRARVAELRAENWTMREIAEELGVGVATVQRDCKEIEIVWRRIAGQAFESHMATVAARFDWLWQQAVKSFLASQTMKKPEGDARFLTLALGQIDKYVKAFGLQSPEEYEKRRVTDMGEAERTDVVEIVAAAEDRDAVEGLRDEFGVISLANYQRVLREQATNYTGAPADDTQQTEEHEARPDTETA